MFYVLDSSRILPQDQAKLIGYYIDIQCISTTQTSWTFNDEPLLDNVKIYDKNKIAIIKVQKFNRGIYECEGKTANNDSFIAQSLLKVVGELVFTIG